MLHRLRLRAALLALVVTSGCIPVVAATSPTSTTSTGTEVHVHVGGSIATALGRVPAGGSVVVHAGSYPYVDVSNRTWPTTVTVRPAPGDRGRVFVAGMRLVAVDNLVVEGLTVTKELRIVRGGRLTVRRSPRLTGVAVRDGTHDLLISDNVIDGGYNGVAIHSWGGEARPARVVVSRNTISGQVNDNIQIGIADDVVVEDNILRDPLANKNHNDGLQFMGGERLVVRRNRFAGQDQAILLKTEGHLGIGNRVGRPRIENNLIANTRGAGIIVVDPVDAEIVNNTVSGTRLAALHVEAGHRNLRVWNNVLDAIWVAAGAARPAYEDHNCARTGGRGLHDVAADPRFVDRDEYRLAAGSPCIDLGSLLGAPITDLTGAPRVGRPDAGAREATR